MMNAPASPVFTLPLVGRVGARERAGVGVDVVFLTATPTPNPSPQGGGEPAGASG